LLFAGITLAFVAFVYLYVPETKGKSLEEVEEQFGLSSDSATGNTAGAGGSEKFPTVTKKTVGRGGKRATYQTVETTLAHGEEGL
jgi:hypothetical protein